jgi:predicted  nucleic acid-binding Zn-ribbon protein
VANLNSASSFDFTEVLKAAIAADPMKFVIFFLLVLIIYLVRVFLKFIDARIGRFEVAVEGLKTSNATHTEDSKKIISDHLDKLNVFQNSLREDLFKAKDEMMRTRYELLQQVEQMKTEIVTLNAKITKTSDGLPTVQEAISEHNKRFEVLEGNFQKFLTALQKKAGPNGT